MKFKVGDVIKRINGETKFRIHAIFQSPSRYKLRRLDMGTVSDLPEMLEDDYELTDPPDDETRFNVGQVLLKKCGSPRIGLITAIRPGADEAHHEYDVMLLTPKGEVAQVVTCYQKELLADFELRNFKWIVLHGNPKKIVGKVLEKTIRQLDEERSKYNDILEALVYVEKEMEHVEEADNG